MKACDICGKEKHCLESLKSDYRTEDIREICGKCLHDVNEQLWKIRKVTNNMNQHWIKRFISNLRIKFFTK